MTVCVRTGKFVLNPSHPRSDVVDANSKTALAAARSTRSALLCSLRSTRLAHIYANPSMRLIANTPRVVMQYQRLGLVPKLKFLFLHFLLPFAHVRCV